MVGFSPVADGALVDEEGEVRGETKSEYEKGKKLPRSCQSRKILINRVLVSFALIRPIPCMTLVRDICIYRNIFEVQHFIANNLNAQ